MVAIDNEDPSLAFSAVQLLQDKNKSISSSVMLTLYRAHSSAIISLEEHCAFFDQGRPLKEPTIRHHEFFPTIIPEKPSNFGKYLKGPDRVNFVKGVF